MDPIDYSTLSDDDLAALVNAATSEQVRRATLANAPMLSDRLNRSVLDAQGISEGDPWRQPVGAFDAYPADAIVSYGGKTYVSLTPGNVWEPPVNWREQTGDPATPPEWVQPTNAEDAYNTGDRVTYKGVVYESLIDANTWAPEVYTAGWQAVTSPA